MARTSAAVDLRRQDEREQAEPGHVGPVALEVLRGFRRTPKSLSPWLFYDARGSGLFERITELPEYYPTRTERRILVDNADAIIAAAGENLRVVELGAGTSSKTAVLLEALLRRQHWAWFHPIDISPTALEMGRQALARKLPGLQVLPIAANNLDGARAVEQEPDRHLVVYLGSSIGNDEPVRAAQFLRHLRATLHDGDALLLGVDMVKDPGVMVPAYDDAQGITAAFNRNVLHRINRELSADFRPDRFKHVALWNRADARIEMHLESMGEQRVSIDALGLSVRFLDGERIHTENSHKFTGDSVRALLHDGGFALERSWTDARGWFGVHLARVR